MPDQSSPQHEAAEYNSWDANPFKCQAQITRPRPRPMPSNASPPATRPITAPAAQERALRVRSDEWQGEQIGTPVKLYVRMPVRMWPERSHRPIVQRWVPSPCTFSDMTRILLVSHPAAERQSSPDGSRGDGRKSSPAVIAWPVRCRGLFGDGFCLKSSPDPWPLPPRAFPLSRPPQGLPAGEGGTPPGLRHKPSRSTA
jgi:hypothetical protein